MAEKGRHLDLSSSASPTEAAKSVSNDAGEKKGKFLGVNFACCDVYSRIYINHDQSAYVGHCPRCAKRIEIRVGGDGSDSRFFTAY